MTDELWSGTFLSVFLFGSIAVAKKIQNVATGAFKLIDRLIKHTIYRNCYSQQIVDSA